MRSRCALDAFNARMRARQEPRRDQAIRYVPEDRIADLKRRIRETRWPEKETADDASQGARLATLKPLVDYWGADYDWRKVESKLNALPQFVTTIDGVDIHFIHVRSRHRYAMPMIITHGWPGSVIGPSPAGKSRQGPSAKRIKKRRELLSCGVFKCGCGDPLPPLEVNSVEIILLVRNLSIQSSFLSSSVTSAAVSGKYPEYRTGSCPPRLST